MSAKADKANSEELKALREEMMGMKKEIMALLAEILDKTVAAQSRPTGARKPKAAQSLQNVERTIFPSTKIYAIYEYQKNKEEMLKRLTVKKTVMETFEEKLKEDTIYKGKKTPEDKLKREATFFWESVVENSPRIKDLLTSEWRDTQQRAKRAGTSADTRGNAPAAEPEEPKTKGKTTVADGESDEEKETKKPGKAATPAASPAKKGKAPPVVVDDDEDDGNDDDE